MTVALRPHTLVRPPGLLECETVLDVGAGIRPMQWYRPSRHVCVEPYGPYAEALRGGGYEVWEVVAEEALARLLEAGILQIDAIYLLDVLEHMETPEGFRVLLLATQIARRQIVVYTPKGFVVQTSDVWGMGGEEWQTHRSGWTPADFPPSWRVVPVVDDPPGFFAIWESRGTK